MADGGKNSGINFQNQETVLNLLQQLMENGNGGGVSRSSSATVVPKNPPNPNPLGITQSDNSMATLSDLQALPDQSEILDRLGRIREHKRQVLDMMDALKKNGGEEIDKEMLRKLINAYDNFKEQEEQYLGILQKILKLKQNFASAAIDESGFQSDVQSESGGRTVRAAQSVDDVVNGNNVVVRPIIEDKMGFFGGDQQSTENRNGNDADDDEEQDELKALIEQRNMLKKMLRQQEELRALQGRHAAQQGQQQQQAQSQGGVREREYLAARQLVDDQAASLAAKRRELEDLKEKLESVKELYGNDAAATTTDHFVGQAVDEGVKRQCELDDKLRVLKGKKQRMDEILNQLSDFHGQNVSQDDFTSQNFARMAPAANQPQMRTPTSNIPQQQRSVALQDAGAALVDNRTLLQQKYQELLETKKRIADVKKLMAQLEEESNNEAAEMSAQKSAASASNSNFSSQFNQRLANINEQQEALNLQNERDRLTAIKHQLLSMNDDQLRQMSSTTNDSRVVRTSDEVWRELRAQAIQREEKSSNEQLNNTKDNASDYSFASRRNVRGSAAATHGSFVQDEDDDLLLTTIYRNNNNNHNNNVNINNSLNAVSNNSNNNLDSAADGIVRNPLLASFRRNNDIQDNSTPQRATTTARCSNVAATTSKSSTTAPPPPANRTGDDRTPMDQQYDQLQQHIDSIRTIFETLMKDRNGGGSMSSSVVAPTNEFLPTPNNFLQSLMVHPSTFAVQQQQLTISLLSCQQQLQLQQMEMRYLQQLCHDLVNLQQQQQRSPASETTPNVGGTAPQPTRSRSASFAQANLTQPVPPPVIPPLDGRPLSSASLYNLLAPNPYLTFPYYPPQMQPPPNVALAGSSKNLLNNSFHAAGFRGYTKSPLAAVGSAPPPSATTSQNRHNSIMEQSNMSDCSDRSLTHVKTPSVNASPAKYASQRSSNVVPKLDLDSLYNKSNVAKKQKNFDNVVVNNTQMSASAPIVDPSVAIGVDPASMSRNSSVASAMANVGYGPDGNVVDQFDALREMIYSEVATLISQNEQRPHYLLELFRELQLLSSDHLRTKALHAIRDVLNRFLTDDTDGNDTEFEYRNAATCANPRTAVEETQTDSAWTSDDEAFKQRKTFVPVSSRDKAHDFSETACSGSTVSTPEQTNAFATTNGLNQTAFHYEKPQTARLKRFEHLEDIKDVKNEQPLNNTTPTKKLLLTPSEKLQRIQNRDFVVSEEMLASKSSNLDVVGLERDIQSIVDELIPFLRDNAESFCNAQLLQYLRKFVLTLTLSKCAAIVTTPTSAAASSETPFFNRQLSTILDDTLSKFNGYKLHECCEEIVADISEVIFNELAFCRLMQNIDPRGEISNDDKQTTEEFLGGIEIQSSVPEPYIVQQTVPDRTISLFDEADFPHIDDESAISVGEKSKTAPDEPSSGGVNFLMRTPSESRGTTPYEELRDVEDTLDYIDDDFQDIDRDEMSAATDNSLRNNNNVPVVVVRNGPTTLAQLCDAE